MKLLVLSPHYAPRFEGGTEVVARAQARALAARGHEVVVAAGCDTPHAGLDVEHERVDGLDVHFLPRLADERYDLLLERPRLLGLIDELAREVDGIHLHGWGTLAGGLVARLAGRVPVVVTLHDLFVTCPRFFRLPVGGVESCPPRGEFEPCVRCVAPDAGGTPPEVLRAGLVERARRWQTELDAAAAVVLPSESQRARLASLVDLPTDRTHVVPHGLCRPVDAKGAAADWVGEGPLRVLHLGNLTAAKGVLDLARAAALATKSGASVELVLGGKAVEPGIDERIDELAAPASVHRLGPYDLDTLGGALAQRGGCHLCVLPSHAHESYGLVVDEALALGLPTWVSDRGAPRERVGAAGRVLPAEDAEALAHALVAVVRDPELLAAERAAIPAELPAAEAAARAIEALFT